MRYLKKLIRLSLCAALVVILICVFNLFITENIITVNNEAQDDLQRYAYGLVSDTQSVPLKPYYPSVFIARNSTRLSDKDLITASMILGDSSQLLDFDDFRFVINSSRTCDIAPFLLAFIHSAPANTHKRHLVRQTWASRRDILGVQVKTVSHIPYL